MKKTLTILSIALGISIGSGLHLATFQPTQKPKQATPQLEETAPPVETIQAAPKPKPYKLEDPMDNDFYQIIIDNNLFRPLGWRPPAKNKITYKLLGTITNSETPARAILQDKASQRTYTVSIDETLGDFQVTEIQPRRITLKNGTQHVTLLLDNTLLINPRSQ